MQFMTINYDSNMTVITCIIDWYFLISPSGQMVWEPKVLIAVLLLSSESSLSLICALTVNRCNPANPSIDDPIGSYLIVLSFLWLV